MEKDKTFHYDEINPYIILRDLFMHLPFIILAVLTVFIGVRTCKNIVYKPEYTANATLAVMAKGNANGNIYSSLGTANSMAEVFTEVFQSDIMRDKVEKETGQKQENAKIKAELIPETNLLVLRVTADDPQSAYRILQVVLNNYRDISDYVFGNAVLEVIKEPQVPVAPSNSFDTSKFDRIGALIAAVLTAGFVVLFSVLRSTVKTTAAGKRNLEGECLAVIPYEEKNRTLKTKLKKTNKAVLLTNPLISFTYEEESHRLASYVDYKASKAGQKVILVTSVAENEGKSTIAANLALALAMRNKKVLLVDMDFKKPALYKLLDHKMQKDQGLLAFLKGEGKREDILRYDHEKQIYLMLNSVRERNAQKYVEDARFKILLEESKEICDYIILDSAPISAGTDTEYFQEYADACVLVIRKDRVPIADLNDAVEQLKEGETEFLGYVLNDFKEHNNGVRDRYGYGYGKYDKREKTTNRVKQRNHYE